MRPVGGAADLIAPPADLTIHRPVQFAFGPLRLCQFLADHIQHLMLQPFLPFPPGLLRLLPEPGQLLLLQLPAALVITIIGGIRDIKSIPQFRMRLQHGPPLLIPPPLMSLRLCQPLPGQLRGLVHPLPPRARLRQRGLQAGGHFGLRDPGHPDPELLTSNHQRFFLLPHRAQGIGQAPHFLLRAHHPLVQPGRPFDQSVPLVLQLPHPAHGRFPFRGGQQLEGFLQHIHLPLRFSKPAQVIAARGHRKIIQLPIPALVQPGIPVLPPPPLGGQFRDQFLQFHLPGLA